MKRGELMTNASIEAADGVLDSRVPSLKQDIFSRGLCLPSDNKMTPEQQDVIIEVIKKCFE